MVGTILRRHPEFFTQVGSTPEVGSGRSSVIWRIRDDAIDPITDTVGDLYDAIQSERIGAQDDVLARASLIRAFNFILGAKASANAEMAAPLLNSARLWMSIAQGGADVKNPRSSRSIVAIQEQVDVISIAADLVEAGKAGDLDAVDEAQARALVAMAEARFAISAELYARLTSIVLDSSGTVVGWPVRVRVYNAPVIKHLFPMLDSVIELPLAHETDPDEIILEDSRIAKLNSLYPKAPLTLQLNEDSSNNSRNFSAMDGARLIGSSAGNHQGVLFVTPEQDQAAACYLNSGLNMICFLEGDRRETCRLFVKAVNELGIQSTLM